MCYFILSVQQADPVLPSASGYKRFFSPQPLDSRELSICGIGIRELMPNCRVERPHGTGDYLLMLFHDPVGVGSEPCMETLEKPDMMMIWPPRKGQFYGNLQQRFTHTWIHCEGKRIQSALRLAKLPVLKPFPVPNPSCFQQCLLDVHGELVSYKSPDTVIIGNLLENCFREISRKLAGFEKIDRTSEGLLAVRRLIATVPSRTITLGEMAALAGMSVPYFCSRFKSAFGLPPMEYLIQHRLHRAAHLLSDRNLTISEIAAQSGYNDLFHFSKMFKKHFRVGPREMRNRQQKSTFLVPTRRRS